MEVDGKMIKLQIVIYNNIYSGIQEEEDVSEVSPSPIIKVSFVK